MIKLNVKFAEKEEVKALGAKWNRDGRFWYIPDDLDFVDFTRWIPSEVMEKLNKPISLTKYLDNLKENTKINSPYSSTVPIVGEVMNVYMTGQYSFLDMTDSPDGKTKLSVFFPNRINEKESLLKNKIAVRGRPELYNGHIQLKAETLQILDEPSEREHLIRTWHQRYMDENIVKASKSNFAVPFTNLYVISSKNSAGYRDFCFGITGGKRRRPSYLSPDKAFKVYPYFVNLTAESIAKKIEWLNKNKKHNACICLIRGGGNAYELTDFNNPVLGKAIRDSLLPVIVAVGHTQDNFLIDDVADKSFSTPADAASWMYNYLLNSKWLSGEEQFEKLSSTIDMIVKKQDSSKLPFKGKVYTSLQKLLKNLLV